MSKPNRKPRLGKAGKPRPDFPLFPHATGRWAKKVRGRFHYFGRVADDPTGAKALDLWLGQKDDLLAGRTPRVGTGREITVRELANHFLGHKRELLDVGEIIDRTFGQLYTTCQSLVTAFGRETPIDALVADDFQRLRAAMAKHLGPVALGNEIQRVRSVFKFGYDAGLIDKPVRYGPAFRRPSAKTLRLNRAKHGSRLLELEELLAILDAASPMARTIILLAVNGGMGNGDIEHLPLRAVNLKTGWITFPRPKTGIDRKIPLWPETIEAIREVLAARPEPKSDESKQLVFLGHHGESLVTNCGYKVGQMFKRIVARAKKARPGLTFYALRHTFQTVAEGARDLVAVQAIMGHAPSSSDMSAVYRERVDDDRLRAVVDHVRRWLWPVAGTKEGK